MAVLQTRTLTKDLWQRPRRGDRARPRQSEHRAAASSWRSWGRAAAASPPCCTCWAGWTRRPRAACCSTASTCRALNDTALTILRRQKIGFVFQFFNLIPVLTALENVRCRWLLDGKPKARDGARRATGWSASAWATGWATGPTSFRAASSSAWRWPAPWSPSPPLILADEPTGNLDSRAADEMLHLLRRTVDEWGRTVVMVTHDARMAAYADRIIFLKDGTVVDDTRLDAAARTRPRDVWQKMEPSRN